MKKFITLIIVAIFATMAAKAETLSTRGVQFRTSIINFLHEEGYASAAVDEDAIKLKIEGKTYYIDIEDYNDNFYVSLNYYIDCEGDSAFKVLKACDVAEAAYKFLKVCRLSDGKTVKIIVPCFMTGMTTFRTMWGSMLYIVQHGRTKYLDNL